MVYKQAVYNLAIGMTLEQLHAEQKIHREEPLTAGGLVLLLELFNVSWDDFLGRVRANLAEAQTRLA
jgi:hypothetical protein